MKCSASKYWFSKQSNSMPAAKWVWWCSLTLAKNSEVASSPSQPHEQQQNESWSSNPLTAMAPCKIEICKKRGQFEPWNKSESSQSTATHKFVGTNSPWFPIWIESKTSKSILWAPMGPESQTVVSNWSIVVFRRSISATSETDRVTVCSQPCLER